MAFRMCPPREVLQTVTERERYQRNLAKSQNIETDSEEQQTTPIDNEPPPPSSGKRLVKKRVIKKRKKKKAPSLSPVQE